MDGRISMDGGISMDDGISLDIWISRISTLLRISRIMSVVCALFHGLEDDIMYSTPKEGHSNHNSK